MISKKLKLKKIKIPKKVSVFFNYEKKIFLITGPFGKKVLKLPFKIFFFVNNRSLVFKNFFFENKKLKITNFFFFLLKKKILEVSIILNKKLIFIGLGYRFFFLDISIPILKLKLGYSHDLFFKPILNLEYNVLKNTNIFLKSNDFNFLNLVSSKLRSYKKPNSYKKKGIYYAKEKIIIKKFKKI